MKRRQGTAIYHLTNKTIMIHYGKEPSGDFKIEISADEIGELYDALENPGLLLRRTFDKMKRCIESEYKEELEAYRRRMTAQIPKKEYGVC